MMEKGCRYKMMDLKLTADRPDKDLVLAIFERAMCDAFGNIQEARREARAWLFDESSEEYTAVWWSELIDAEAFLEQMRKVVKYGAYKKTKGRGWLKKGKFFGY